jgi:hypothetical protein
MDTFFFYADKFINYIKPQNKNTNFKIDDNVLEIKEHFYGSQNQYIDHINPDKYNKLLDLHNNKFKTSQNYYINAQNKHASIEIPYVPNSAVKNFRFNRNIFSNIKTIELQVGGSRIDYINSDRDIETDKFTIFSTLRHLYEIKDEAIVPFYLTSKLLLPITKYSKIKLIISFFNACDSDVQLLYDLCEIAESPLEMPICQTQHGGRKLIISRTLTCPSKNSYSSCIKLQFNHQIYYLILKIHDVDIKNIRGVKLLFDKEVNLVIKKNNLQFHNNFIIIPFTPSLSTNNIIKYGINFSRMIPMENFSKIIPSPILKIYSDESLTDKNIDVYGISLQPMRFMSGMAGLAFTK